jgi:hypothetical protein
MIDLRVYMLRDRIPVAVPNGYLKDLGRYPHWFCDPGRGVCHVGNRRCFRP